MANDFLDMNKEAKELVTSLKKLNDEVQGYKTSKEQLSDLNKTLSGFINETKKHTEQSAKVIENTSKLTPSKINKKVDEINKRIDAFDKIIKESLLNLTETTNKNTTSGLSKIDKKVVEMSKRIDTFEILVNKMVDRVERSESSSSNQIKLLINAVESTSEAIKNKKFSLFGKKD